MTGAPELVELAPGWSLWPTAALRSAGLPIELLGPFAVPDLLAEPPGEQRNAAIRRAAAGAAAAVVRDDRFREALVWQNPELIDTWLGAYATRLADEDSAQLSNRAYREVVIARYAQRYCAKNESIGFFGPVGWARLTPSATGLQMDGCGGIRRRTVSLETWAVKALADAWRRDPRILDDLPVRLDPATSWSGDVLRQPRRTPVPCDGLTARLLTAVDGHRRCGEVLAVAAVAAGCDPVDARAELLRLDEAGVVRIGFRVPYGDQPEQYLRQQVEQLPAERTRAELLRRLDDIGEAHDGVPAGRPEEVRAALGELTGRFAKAGWEAAGTRRSAYARTPAYLDARRDTDVRIGGDLLEPLRAPLGILLDSARWLGDEVAAAVDEGLLDRYHRLRGRRAEVTLSDLQFAASDLLAADGPLAATVRTDFQLRWAEILPPDPTGEIRLTSAEVGPLAGALFPAAGPRWAAARQHSPDLLLGRAADGSLRWVLGELHVALNTLESRVFRTQSDDPEELVRLTAADMSDGRVVPLYPPDAPEATARTYPPLALDPPGLYHYWSYGSDDGHPDGAASVAGTDVLVRERDGELVGEVRGRGWSAPVLEFFGEFLTATAVNLFQLRARRPHLHRVLLDDVVVARESWSCPIAELPVPPPGRKIADRGYQELREWAAALGMPRHVFARTPLEKKPFYVDFDAPLLVGNLMRAVRRVVAEAAPGDPPATLDLVEMLPRPDELWLTDAAGQHYTAELRVVAVDDRRVPPVVRFENSPGSTPTRREWK
ncbi:lantibiotic dehydratase [Micromonospora sp. RTGN7]|uniref:lantibiotic dehydratase n=1 Tax=Micromonospora sp. RTGN7 TaxID=3016526 RepID=UPI0029FF50D7|nr:lantibiotic dehydratase [Micromonospora sp. RTGN7]